MNNPNPNDIPRIPTNLDEIRQMKTHTYRKLQQQKKAVGKSARKLVAPLAPAVSKGNSIMRAFNTGLMAFDGVMLGIKLIRKFRRALKY